jgi:uncharacterized membrane protein
MFQTHCYDSWLRPDLRETRFYKWSQLGGTLPAPLFIFLAGLSFALVTERLREKAMARNAIALQTIRRGAEIFGLGIVFRVQEYALGYRWVPWTDLLRVDILNILGISMMLMGVLCWFTAAATVDVARFRSIIAAFVTAAGIACITPLLWTTWRPRFLPWPLESYLNGVHTFTQPQPWLFPIFPWTAFAFAGLGVGFLIFTEFVRRREARFFACVGLAGIFAMVVSSLLEASPVRLYPVHDYWHSHPDFFLARCGALAITLFLVYAWCRWGFAQKGFSPILQLGTTSLLVYWAHIEFVYGRFSILPKRQSSIAMATFGLCVIFLAMLALSVFRTRFKKGAVRALPEEPRPTSAPVAAT